jgi:hypothetical protein
MRINDAELVSMHTALLSSSLPRRITYRGAWRLT